MNSIGFQQSKADPCVFINETNGVILAIYVDDSCLVGHLEEIKKVKIQLSAEFEMKDLGELEYFLGILVTRDRSKRTITLSQKPFIKTILDRFGMLDCKPVSTPVTVGAKLLRSVEDDGFELVEPRDYQCIISGQSDVGYAWNTPRHLHIKLD